MAKYTIQYIPRDPKDMVVIEMERERLTSQDFKTIVFAAFSTACEGCDYDVMYIPVYMNRELVFALTARTIVNVSEIYCEIHINHRDKHHIFYRRMNIAS